MDNVYLTSPAGSMIAIGSWMRADPAPDYGARDLVTQAYNQNAFVDGGQFSYEFAGIRKMSFPLLVPSGGISGQSLDAIEQLLRLCARPSGFIDIQPDGVPTAEMVRFDLLGGRVNHDPYNVFLQRIDRRFLRLELDTPPFGYWPTWITLASTAGLAMPLVMALNGGASVIGDVPAPVRLVISPSAPRIPSGPPGSWGIDLLAWSFGAPSHYAAVFASALPGRLFSAGGPVLAGLPAATYRSDVFASSIAGPTVVDYFIPPAAPTQFGGSYRLTDLTRAATSGRNTSRYRAFGWFSLSPSGVNPAQVMLDSTFDGNQPLASGGRVATIIPAVASGSPSVTAWGALASPGYTLYDLGEITHPPADVPSGLDKAQLRLFFQPASSGATQMISLAGLFLHPLDGPNGIIGRGIVQPSVGVPAALIGLTQTNAVKVVLDAAQRQTALGFFGGGLVDFAINTNLIKSAADVHRGGFPFIGASTAWLTVLAETRLLNQPSVVDPLIHSSNISFNVSVAYRPTFAFLKGL